MKYGGAFLLLYLLATCLAADIDTILQRLEVVEQACNEVKQTNEELLVKIAQLERRLTDRDEVISRPQGTILGRKKTVVEPESISTLRKESTRAQHNHTSMLQNVVRPRYDGNVPGVNTEQADPEAYVQRVKRQIVEGPIAFHALKIVPGESHIGIHQHFVFENVKLNLGGGFHELHGLFITPVAGIYLFSTSITSGYNNGKDYHYAAALMVNGNRMAQCHGYDDSGMNDQGSVTATVQLQAGDEVWVELIWPDQTFIRADGYTSFTGVLIMPL